MYLENASVTLQPLLRFLDLVGINSSFFLFMSTANTAIWSLTIWPTFAVSCFSKAFSCSSTSSSCISCFFSCFSSFSWTITKEEGIIPNFDLLVQVDNFQKVSFVHQIYRIIWTENLHESTLCSTQGTFWRPF